MIKTGHGKLYRASLCNECYKEMEEKMVDYGKRNEKCPKCNSDLLNGNDFHTGEDYIRCSNPKCTYFFSWGK